MSLKKHLPASEARIIAANASILMIEQKVLNFLDEAMIKIEGSAREGSRVTEFSLVNISPEISDKAIAQLEILGYTVKSEVGYIKIIW